ncbi:AbrB/MazE/SpoVT family DNA-binding domain-containing protein [Desulfovibrio piger]
MQTITLSLWGKSLALRIPKKVVDKYGMQAGDKINLIEKKDYFEVRKIRAIKRYNLEEILAGVETMPKEDIIDWGRPYGREIF